MKGDDLMWGVIGLIGLGILWLMTKAWAWAIAFFVAGVAAAFTTLGMIFHFSILPAMGMALVSMVCFVLAAAVGAFAENQGTKSDGPPPVGDSK